MTAEVHDGDVLRPVPTDARESTLIGDYLGWLEARKGLRFGGYDDLYAWSVEDLDALLGCAQLASEIVGRELPSALLHAGPRTRTYAS